MTQALDTERLGQWACEAGLGLMVLFGSAARGSSRPGDYDLACWPSVAGESGLSGWELARTLAAEHRRGDLDVVWMPTAGGLLWSEVARDGVLLHEERAGLFQELQSEARRRLWDELVWHRRDRDFLGRVLEGAMELNRVLIGRELAALAEHVRKLEVVMAGDRSRFITDFTQHHLGERLLELLVECSTTINSEVGQAVAGKASPDYYSSFFVLAEAGWISPELARPLGDMVVLRNGIVHRYHQVQLGDLYDKLQASLPLWRDYLRVVSEKLETSA